MAKQDNSPRARGSGRFVTVKATGKASARVKFGNVVVSGEKPSPERVKDNVQRSTHALERVAGRIIKPGVSLRPKKSVPYFSADEHEPGVVVRRLGDQVERGRLVNGQFKVFD